VVIAVVAALAYSKVHTPKYESSALVQENGITTSAAGGQSSPVTLPTLSRSSGARPCSSRRPRSWRARPAPCRRRDRHVDATTGQLDITARMPTRPGPGGGQGVLASLRRPDQSLIQAQEEKITAELTSLQHQIGLLQASDPSGTDSVITAQITD